MIYGVYCIRDVKNGFTAPMLDSNDETAVRNFETQVKNAEINPTLFFNRPDFSLYKFGSFDTENGHYDLFEIPKILIEAASVNISKDKE